VPAGRIAGSTTVLKKAEACGKFGQENMTVNSNNGSEKTFEDGFVGGIIDGSAVKLLCKQ
jgi:hypothetical protein